MGNTSFIASRTAPAAPRDVLAEPRTQFAELTGAYWLEPIYAKLAGEWDRQGRTVPGAPREHWRVRPDGSRAAETPDRADVPVGAEGTDGERDASEDRAADNGSAVRPAEHRLAPAGRERVGPQDGPLEGGAADRCSLVPLPVPAPE